MHAHALVAASTSTSVSQEDPRARQPPGQPQTAQIRVYRWVGSSYVRVTDGQFGELDIVVRMEPNGRVEATVLPGTQRGAR